MHKKLCFMFVLLLLLLLFVAGLKLYNGNNTHLIVLFMFSEGFA